MIDGTLLIDFPVDTYMHVLYGGLQLNRIHTCIITHNHSDHFYPADFEMRGSWFAELNGDEPFTVYATYPALEQAKQVLDHCKQGDEGRIVLKEILPFVSFKAEGYSITPLRANHDPKCNPVIFIIEKNGKRLLYANDTGYFTEDTWEYLEKQKYVFDLVSLDCTAFYKKTSGGHMGLPNVIEVRKRLKDCMLTNENTTYVLNHFSHFGRYTYDDMLEEAKKEGFLIAYDNFEMNI